MILDNVSRKGFCLVTLGETPMKTRAKWIFFCLAVFLSPIQATSQVKVFSDGRMELYAQVGTWGKALKTTVSSPLSCAYHLSYNNADVSYFCAEGWL